MNDNQKSKSKKLDKEQRSTMIYTSIFLLFMGCAFCFCSFIMIKEILEGKQNSIKTVISITLGIVFIGFAIFIIKTLISDSKPENKPKSIFDDYYNSNFENNDNTNDDISTHHS